MKQKLLNSFRLKATLLVAILCSLFTGTAWGDTTVTISISSFSGLPSTAKYDTYNWSQGGISGKATIYGSTSATSMQFNTSNYLFYSTSATSGKIKSIKLTTASGANRTYVVYGSTSAYSGSGTSYGTQIGSQTVTTSGTTFTVSSGEYTYFTIVKSGSGAGYLSSVEVTYEESSAPAYTITAQSNNNYGTVSLSGSVITATPVDGYTYADPAYSVSPANSATVVQNGDEFTVTPSANTTVTINFAAIPTYSVTLGDNSEELEEDYGGAGVDLPTRSDVGSYTFAGWSTTNVPTETTTAPTIIRTDETYHPTANITLYPVYTKTEGGSSQEKTTNVTISDYASAHSWENSIAYQPLTMDSNISVGGTISGNNFKYYNSDTSWRFYTGGSFTVSASNGATLTSIKLTFSGGTLTYDETPIESNTAFDVSGTEATISCTANAKVTAIEVKYSFSATYYWSTPSATERVAQPTITIAGGPFVSSKLVTITTETDGAAIQYSTDGGTNWTSYSAPFSISATTTVQAKATKTGMDDSHVAEATFTKGTVLEGLSALAAQTNTTNASYYVNLTNAQVTYVTGNNGFMEDANAGIYVYSASPVLNKVYNGIFQVTYQVYNGLPELKAITAVEGTITDGSDKAATEVTLSTLTSNWNANLGRKVQVRATLTSNGDLADGYSLYKYDNGITTEGLKTYTLVGYPYIHSNSPQFNIISAEEVQLQDNSIIMVGPDYTIDVSVSGSGEVNMTSAQASHGTLQSEVVTASTTVDASKYNFAGNVLNVHDVTEGGVIVIRYWVDADAEYNAVELIVPIYLKANPTIAYDGETESTAYGTPYTIDTDLISGGGDITVSSGNTAVATVDGLTITPVAVGSTTITINTAETNIWNAGTATFTLNVTAPQGLATAYVPTPVTVFEETFASCTGTNSDFGTSSTGDGNGTFTADLGNEWVVANAYGANGAAKFGASKKEGSATTPSITTTNGTTYRLTFKAAPWASESTTMTVTITGGTIDDENSVVTSSMSTGEWKEFSYDIVASSTSMSINFSGSNNRFFLDEVKVTKPGTPLTATLNTSGYATYCSQYPLDFTGVTDYSAWQITGISGTTITFAKVTGSVKGGTGLLLMGTASETITLTSADSDNTLDDNKLEGTLAPTYVTAETAYGLSGDVFKLNNVSGTISAGRAYLPAATVNAAGVKSFTFVFHDEATGITETRTATREEVEAIFNLAGQRLNKMQKGINIVNGKKVLVK